MSSYPYICCIICHCYPHVCHMYHTIVPTIRVTWYQYYMSYSTRQLIQSIMWENELHSYCIYLTSQWSCDPSYWSCEHFNYRRFFGGDDDDRPELMGCISGTYSNAHIVLSRELASSNPELTLPLFSGKSVVLLVGGAILMLVDQ